MSRHLLLCLVVTMVGCSGTRSSQIGMAGGSFAACPDSPRKVQTRDTPSLPSGTRARPRRLGNDSSR